MPRFIFLLLALMLSACGIREFDALEIERQAAWRELLVLFQQRTALTANLQSAARTLPKLQPAQIERLAQARARALPPANPSADEAAAQQEIVQVQGELVAALTPVLAQARAQAGLRPLVQQFEGLDNRIRVALQRYQLAASRYNRLIVEFPSSLTARAQGRQPRTLLPLQP